MIETLFQANRRWASALTRRDPDFFRRQVHSQDPSYLWLGCSDSRVPASQILGLDPGDIFVHRNVANLVEPTDRSGRAALEFAVGSLHVRHVIVCGHTGCGGVEAALDTKTTGAVHDWVSPLREISTRHADTMNALATREERLALLEELNVVYQVSNVCGAAPLQQAWSAGADLHVYGWVFDVASGRLRDLEVTVDLPDTAAPVITQAIDRLITRRTSGSTSRNHESG